MIFSLQKTLLILFVFFVPSEQGGSGGGVPPGGCSTSNDCTNPLKPVCSSSNTCVCTQNSDCAQASASYCNLGTGVCDVCTLTFECSHLTDAPVCLSGTGCVDCITSSDCTNPLKPICSSSNTCVCTQDSDCAQASTSHCNLGTGVCEGCTADTECSHLSGGLNVCSSGTCIAPAETRTVVSTVKAVTVATMAVSGAMIFLGGNPAVLWALISLMQVFFYLIFINVEYPNNVQEFFNIFSMGSFNFLPNPFEWIVPDIENMSLPAPKKFLENDVNGFFLGSTGEDLLIWAVVLIMYLLGKLFLKYTRNMPILIVTICHKSVRFIEWSGLLRTAIASYTDLALAAFLQIRVLDFTGGGVYAASSLCGILCVIFAVFCPVLVYYLIRKYSAQTKILERKYLTLVEEYRITDRMPKYFVVLFLARRLSMVLTLVFLHDYPYMEICLLLVNCFVWALLQWKYSPYEGKLSNRVNFASEIVFIVIHFLIGILVFNEDHGWYNEEQKTKIGWLIIAACVIVIAGVSMLSVVDNYKAMKEFISFVRKMMKGKVKGEKMKKKQSLRISPEYSPSPPKAESRDDKMMHQSPLPNDYLGSFRETEDNFKSNNSFILNETQTQNLVEFGARRQIKVKRQGGEFG